MLCKICGFEMLSVFTGDLICRECGIKRDAKGKFISRDVRKKQDYTF